MTEVINVARTEHYARHMAAFKPVYKNNALSPALGESYDSPLQDDAPWTDPDNLDTYGFYGVYPLDITGLENSTWSAPVIESTRNGGAVGSGRYASKPVVFNCVLVGESDCAVAAGLAWLKSVLAGPPCYGPSVACGGQELCYLSCEPMLDWTVDTDISDCLTPYMRSLHDVTTTLAPSINAKSNLPSGGAAWLVSWTMTAGNPFEFGPEIPLIQGFMDPLVTVPYVGGEVPDGGGFDVDGFVQSDEPCPVAVYAPVVDPLCPQIIAPPTAPAITLACFNFPVNYMRRQVLIPKANVPLWGEVVPRIQIKARTKEIRNLRVRFYADVFESGDPNTDVCNFCGDMVFSYVPAGSTLVFDGTDEQVYVETVNQGRRRADSLVFGSDGTPFEWPQLTCGFGYIVTFDMPQVTDVLPVIDLSLTSRAS